MSQQLQEQILEQIKDLPDEKQRRVLDFVHTLAISRPRGVTGVDHLPIADEEAHVLLLEPKTTLNTGNVGGDRTVADLERL